MITNLPTKHILASSQSQTSQRFTYKMAAKTAGIDMKQNYVTVTLCITRRVCRAVADLGQI